MNSQLKKRLLIFSFFLTMVTIVSAQADLYNRITWSEDGNSFFISDEGAIMKFNLAEKTKDVFVTPEQLTPAGAKQPLEIKGFFFSPDFKKLLIYTNSKMVWRYETRGDYWVYDFSNSTLKKLGKHLLPLP